MAEEPRKVLELRVHGVNNTSPAHMLDLPESSIEQVTGDTLGSFWRPTDDARGKLKESDRGYVRSGITREAYSWGGMARSSVGVGNSSWGKLLGGLIRFGWTTLLPFGLINVAYWSRRLTAPMTPDSSDDSTDAAGATPGHPDASAGRGASTVRIAALLLTLLFVTAAATVSLDLVGVQCFAGGQKLCRNLPKQSDFLAGWTVTRRLALLGLIPIVLVAGLAVLAVLNRTRYTDATSDAILNRTDAATTSPRWPMLSTPGFWNHGKLYGSTTVLHIAAATVLIVALTAWHVAFGVGDKCASPADVIFLRHECREQVGAGGWYTKAEIGFVVLCLALLALIVALVVRRTAQAADIAPRPQPRWMTWVVLACAVTFLGHTLVLWNRQSSQPTAHPMLGISAVAALLLASLLAIGLSGLSWRRGRVAPVTTLSFGAILLIVISSTLSGAVAFVPVVPGFVMILAAIVLAGRGDDRGRGHEAWRGLGPGVWIIVSVLIAFLLSSAVAVAAGDWLNAKNSAATLACISPSGNVALSGACATKSKPDDEQKKPEAGASCPAVEGACACPCDKNEEPPALLGVPRPFIWFGAAIVVLLVPLVVLAVMVARRVFSATIAAATIEPDARAGAMRKTRGDPQGTVESPTEPLGESRLRRRQFAAFAQHAEGFVGALALIATTALALTLTFAVMNAPRLESVMSQKWVGTLLGGGLWALALGGAAVIGLAVGGSALGGTRPLGLLWDLICFLPAAAHPFGPPCYAERVVPELLSRYRWWLSAADGDDQNPAEGRTIVVSAHSLGAVLAAATIFSGDNEDEVAKQVPSAKISLLTYGVQLRAYFGRLFPELLGPDVLGTQPLGPPILMSADPWAGEQSAPAELPRLSEEQRRRSLRGRLTDDAGRLRWLNLWRRTDYLGFPVNSYAPNAELDEPAEEVDTSGYLLEVLTHGDYPRTEAYRRALDHLTRPQPGS